MTWIFKKLAEDWKAKLVSLFLAGIFWIYVQELQYDTVTLSVPVEYLRQPENLFWKTDPPRFVKLKVRGKNEDTKFPTANLKATVDLNDAKQGIHTYRIQFDKKQIPDKLNILAFNDAVIIDFDKGVQKSLWVKPVILGEVPDGFKRGRMIISPDRILVEGPAQILDAIRSINTKPINIADLKETFTFRTQISSENQIRMINGSEIAVTITVYKQDTTNERLVENVKIDILGKDPALTAALSTNFIKVYIRGDAEDLRRIDPNQFHAFINLEGTRFIAKTLNILPFDYEPDIIVNIKNLYTDKKIEILELIPATVSVRFSVKPEFLKKAEEMMTKEAKNTNDQTGDDIENQKAIEKPAQ